MTSIHRKMYTLTSILDKHVVIHMITNSWDKIEDAYKKLIACDAGMTEYNACPFLSTRPTEKRKWYSKWRNSRIEFGLYEDVTITCMMCEIFDAPVLFSESAAKIIQPESYLCRSLLSATGHPSQDSIKKSEDDIQVFENGS